ncbi:MAG: TetR/AcrR family transcriptional regulator [Alphaproteobacteria bacterium]|nr:TetR/AcrR family transcriptional regulator [Alphaproteobacteria bacterium]
MAQTSPRAASSSRASRAAERRQAIVDAALEEFVTRGFAATRLDDIARRAGVAKGTIYLHFKDKQSLFEELVRVVMVPVVAQFGGKPAGSVREHIETRIAGFLHNVAIGRRGDLVRLIVAEGPRFPAVGDFYYREVVSKGIEGMRFLIELAIARGEITERGLARFPQIMVASALMGVIWQSLFANHAPLDVQAMVRVHLDLIFG